MILFLSSVLWKGQRQRPQHLAAGLARTEPVLFVEPMTLGQRPYATPVEAERNVFVVSIPVIPYNARMAWIRGISHVLGTAAVSRDLVLLWQRRAIRNALGRFPKQGVLRVLLHDFLSMPLAKSLAPRSIVFDYIDDVFGFTKLPDSARQTWLAALTGSSAVTVTSPTLQRIVRTAAGVEAVLVSNGVEYSHFAAPGVQRPGDLPETGQPVVLYIGSVYPWLDFDLIDQTVRASPEIQFVFIGRSHPDVETRLAHLKRQANFTYLGFRPYETLPGYLHNAAAAIIPFLRNALTASVNPVKLYEQSAAGVPTVATAFSDDLDRFADRLFIARSRDEFPSRLREAIGRGADPAFQQALQAFGRENDWNVKVSTIENLLRQDPVHEHAHRPGR